MGGRGSWSATWKNENSGMLSPGQGGNKPSEKIHASQFKSIFGGVANERITAIEAEKAIVAHSYETGIIIDGDGFVQAAYKGHRGYVGFWDSKGNNDYNKLAGNTMTHNHPSGSAAFSPADIAVSAKYGVKEVRAATKSSGTVSVKAANHRADWDGFSKAYDAAFSKGMTAARSRQWMRDNAGKYNLVFTYERSR